MESTKISPKAPRYLWMDGFPYPADFVPENVTATINYKPRDDDHIISTFPKCGTTWTQYIVTLIFRRGQPFSGPDDFFRLTPFMEMTGSLDVINMPRPGIMKTHLPYHMTPKSTKAKYIYVVRNPKDCCVSLYHHTRMFDNYEFQDGDFNDFFEEFINGRVEYGDFFDHLIGWYEHRNDPNVFFITYETMKADKRKAVMDIARFLGSEYYDMLENNPEILDNVLRYSSFDHMKVDTNALWTVLMNPDKLSTKALPNGLRGLIESIPQPHEKKDDQEKEIKKATFVRKGIVGDWKNLMSEEQSRRLEQKFKQKAKGSDVLNLWKDVDFFQHS